MATKMYLGIHLTYNYAMVHTPLLVGTWDEYRWSVRIDQSEAALVHVYTRTVKKPTEIESALHTYIILISSTHTHAHSLSLPPLMHTDVQNSLGLTVLCMPCTSQ